MRHLGIVIAVLTVAFAAPQLCAAEGSPAFVVEVPMFKYNLLTAKRADAAAVSTSKTQTVPIADAYFAYLTGFGQIVYVFPFADLRALAVGHFVTAELEVGPLVGYNRTTNRDEEELRDTYGLFVRWHKPLGAHKLELWGTAAMNDNVAKRSIEHQPPAKGNLSYASFDIDANYVIPLSPHVKYVAGLKYKLVEGRDHLSYTRIGQNEFEVKVLALRAVLE